MAKKTELAVIPALNITPDLPVSIEGNFKAVENYLRGREKEISALELTEDNIELVKAVKSEAVTYRRRAEEIVKNVKQRLFKDPENVLKAKVQPIFDLIASIEKRTDEVLDKQEEERIFSLRTVLDDYCEQFEEKYHLEARFRGRVEYKKQYYNKTAVEKETKADLEGQFIVLKKEQDAYVASLRLISTACNKDKRLNPMLYVNMLDTKDVATILEEIELEEKRLDALDEPKVTIVADDEETEKPAAPENIVLGVTTGIDFSTDFPGRTKTICKEITYPCDVAPALNELFKRLEQYGVTMKTIKKPEMVY